MTEYDSTTTLKRIREGSPDSGRACEDGWVNLLKHLGKTKADDEPIDLLTVLDGNGLDDAVWVLSYAMPDDRLSRHFRAWCAEQIVHLTGPDQRCVDQIAMLRNDGASDAERDAASDAAWDAASAAARAAASDAASDAARAAASDAQEIQLRKMLAGDA